MISNSYDFDQMYKDSYYTIVGAGGDLQKWVNGYIKFMTDRNIGVPSKWFTFKGKDLNNFYDLKNKNRFNDDLTFLCFPTDNLEISKLSMFKLQMEDRWFDDLVDNSTR